MKNKNKKAFTLIEVMVTLAIFSVVSVLLSAILIQGQRILLKVDNRTAIQDQIRIALLKIQSEAQISNEVIVNDKFGKFNNNKWLLDSTDNTARELVRFSKEGENTAKVYVEVNDGNKHQLIEFSINKANNEILDNSTNVLINEINGNDANAISINVEDINDSKGNKINELITINCFNIVKGADINESEYLVSFTNDNENIINIDIGTGSEIGNNTDVENPNNNDNDLGSNGSTENDIDNSWESDWEKYGIKISLNSENGNWIIDIQNNSNFDIFGWEIFLKSSNGKIESYYNGQVEYLDNNTYKIYSNNFYQNEIKKGASKRVEGKINGQMTNNINDIVFKYKKVKEQGNEYIELGNSIKLRLAMTNQWDGTAQWRIDIKNDNNININKWELTFEFEKPIKGVGWGLQFENLGNNRYKIKNNEQNTINSYNQISITFESESGVIDRNLKNIRFYIIN